MADTLLTSVEDGIATLRLNRPDDMNSLDADTARSIRAAVEGFAGDEAVRVLVLASEGRVFSAGGDFNWVLTWPTMDAITRHVGADALMA
ncbi:MAG: enoyl-CoA hydratase/isomerase family protein, partial [Proteobacteria bacterium]|nr:enoyl-CoA hydratase/isomerase family protein [Pseudomonadota bacterium]